MITQLVVTILEKSSLILMMIPILIMKMLYRLSCHLLFQQKQACVGIKVDFSLTGYDAKMSFLWNFGDGSFSSEPDPSHIYEEEGVFDVTLSVRSPRDGAIRTRTIEKTY